VEARELKEAFYTSWEGIVGLIFGGLALFLFTGRRMFKIIHWIYAENMSLAILRDMVFYGKEEEILFGKGGSLNHLLPGYTADGGSGKKVITEGEV